MKHSYQQTLRIENYYGRIVFLGFNVLIIGKAKLVNTNYFDNLSFKHGGKQNFFLFEFEGNLDNGNGNETPTFHSISQVVITKQILML